MTAIFCPARTSLQRDDAVVGETLATMTPSSCWQSLMLLMPLSNSDRIGQRVQRVFRDMESEGVRSRDNVSV